MNNTKKSEQNHPSKYAPTPQEADKIAANREQRLTDSQRIPIIVAATISGVGLFIFSLITLISVWGLIVSLSFTGLVGALMLLLTGASFFFLLVVFWTNAEMFVPEALNKHPVIWARGPLEVKWADRERAEMPFVYIIDDYSFAPFLPTPNIPLDIGREYIVYYTPRSRLLLSLAPTDQSESKEWLPAKAAKKRRRQSK